MHDDVAAELKEQKQKLAEIRQTQAAILGTMRQLLSKFEPKAKRQRVEVLMDVFRNSTKLNCEHHKKSLLSELSAILYNKIKQNTFVFSSQTTISKQTHR